MFGCKAVEAAFAILRDRSSRVDESGGRVPIIWIVAPEGDVPRAGLWFPVGSADAPRSGTAHLLEHVLLEQTVGKLRLQAAQVNALTSHYWTAYLVSGELRSLLQFLAMDTRSFIEASITGEIADDHRRVVKMEMLERRSVGDYPAAARSFFERCFPHDDIFGDVAGTIDDLEAITTEDLSGLQLGGYRLSKPFFFLSAPQSQLARVVGKWPQFRTWMTLEDSGQEFHGSLGRTWAFRNSERTELPDGVCTASADGHFRCGFVEDSSGTHLAFACGGTPFNWEESETALVIVELLQDWLMRETPDSLRSVLRDTGVELHEGGVRCHLTPDLRPIVVGVASIEEGVDREKIRSILLRYPAAAPRVENEVFRKLKDRALSSYSRRPMWTTQGMLLLGGRIATYGPAAAINFEATVEKLRISDFLGVFLKLQGLAVGERQT